MDHDTMWIGCDRGGYDFNGKFAQFRTNPPPEWTVARDNTMHHFARLKISAKPVRVEVSGVTGDGKPPVVLDTFQYSADGCQ
jgi:hypothetical protein